MQHPLAGNLVGKFPAYSNWSKHQKRLIFNKVLKAKTAMRRFSIVRGLEQIRTAVEAFAELCLATRPRDHYYYPKLSIDQPASPSLSANSGFPAYFFGWLQN
jgi:hypothetical protein